MDEVDNFQSFLKYLGIFSVIFSKMDGPRDYHTKSSKSERQIPYDITYMWNLKYDINELIYKTETDLWLPRQRWVGGGIN